MNLSIHPCRLLFSRPKTTASKPGIFFNQTIEKKEQYMFQPSNGRVGGWSAVGEVK